MYELQFLVLHAINFHDYEHTQGNRDDHSLRQTFTWLTILFSYANVYVSGNGN